MVRILRCIKILGSLLVRNIPSISIFSSIEMPGRAKLMAQDDVDAAWLNKNTMF